MRCVLTIDVTICIVSAGAHYALVYIDVRPTRFVNGGLESYIREAIFLEERDGFVDKQAHSSGLPMP
jgi:hypothetical protein